MKNISRLVPAAAAIAILLPAFSQAGVKSIYGDDNRTDYYQSSPAMKKLADSVVSFWPSKQVKIEGGVAKLATIGFGDALNLCPGETFREQPIGAFCSGTLVGKDIVMTAGHCITDEASCADARMVFGFNIDNERGAANTIVPAKDVYSCKRIIKRDLNKQHTSIIALPLVIIKNLLNIAGPDFALVQLDRPVTDRAPLQINRKKDIKKGTPVYVIGHPVGLPVKVAGDAKVRDTHRAFFTTDLDTFGGNSGSAVFNAKTNLIEGILRGGTDFVDSPAGCKVQLKSGQDEGKGEAVTRIAMLQKYIPEIGAAKSAEPEVVNMPVEPVAAPAKDLSGKIQF